MTDSIIEPTSERAQHNPVERATKPMQDVRGDISRPYEVKSLLASMEDRGAITTKMRRAGEEFERLFYVGHLDPIKAADMGRSPMAHGSPFIEGAGVRVERARVRIHDAMRAMGGHGSPAAECAWHVLGCGKSVSEWARREGWQGRPINQHAASGILIGALGILELFFEIGIGK